MLITDKNEFIDIVGSNLPTPPPYFANAVAMNKNGYKQLIDIIKTNNNPVTMK